MQLILNIGLNTSPKFGHKVRKIKAGSAVSSALLTLSLCGVGYTVLSAKVKGGQTEDTLILKLSGDFNRELLPATIHRIASNLSQECIAYRVRDNDGSILFEGLSGLYANEWGEFNSDFFYE